MARPVSPPNLVLPTHPGAGNGTADLPRRSGPNLGHHLDNLVKCPVFEVISKSCWLSLQNILRIQLLSSTFTATILVHTISVSQWTWCKFLLGLCFHPLLPSVLHPRAAAGFLNLGPCDTVAG